MKFLSTISKEKLHITGLILTKNNLSNQTLNIVYVGINFELIIYIPYIFNC